VAQSLQSAATDRQEEHMRILVVLLSLTGLCNAGNAVFAAETAGGAAAYGNCASCHGPAGEGNATLQAPRISHLQPAYLKSQLRKFRNGHRGGEGASAGARQMAAMAAALAGDEAVDAVVAHLGTLASESSPATVEGDIALGADYYNQFCGACHGARAEGNAALRSPRLAGSDDWYLLSQLAEFRAGRRGMHPDDRTGRQMRSMAAVLPDESAMRDVVAFIKSLEP
jgi:cytochrome c oxidase subunit 2